jgi:hypothetical protein
MSHLIHVSPSANVKSHFGLDCKALTIKQWHLAEIFGLWTGEFLVIANWPCHSEPLGEESEAAGLFSSINQTTF